MFPKKLQPESLMMSYGYDPQLSEGAIKCPIFQNSTFVFRSASEGKAFFEVAYGLREKTEGEDLGLIYSRLNNPDMEILENRLTLWDKAEDCAVFESGMSAITTVLLKFLSPGDLLLYSNPVYGGTSHFVSDILTKYGIEVMPFGANENESDIIQKLEVSGKADRLAMIYIETPANPTNTLIDITMCRDIANRYQNEESRPLICVDNTYMGPLWQNPLELGADLVLYSATKYIGGHSDLIAGACLGSTELIGKVKEMRTFLGNMLGPWTGWLLMRSLETLKMRMTTQSNNAKKVAAFLNNHPKVEKVHFLGLIDDPRQQDIYDKQCKGTGAMVSFNIRGGEAEAFALLDHLKLIKLAVSLGSTESLAEHPASMTHAGVPPEDRAKYQIDDNLVRLSIGVENPDDIVWDLEQALQAVLEPAFT